MKAQALAGMRITLAGTALLACSAVSHAADEARRVTAFHAPAAPSARWAQRCDSLAAAMTSRWPDRSTRVLQSAWRSSGYRVSTMAGPVSLPAHCEIVAALDDRVGIDGEHYAIHLRLRLPERWNGRFLFEGGGGSEGDIGDAIGGIAPGVLPAIDQGYAVVSQDSGHDNRVDFVPGRGGALTFGFDPQARANYGGASLLPVAQAAKAAIREFYDRMPERSYFEGCSKGGQEGLAFAERYPQVFDGILAGSPGMSLPRAAVAEAWDTQAFASLVAPAERSKNPGLLSQTFSDAQFALIRDSVLAACDAGDGVRDGIVGAFSSCRWAPVERQLMRRLCSTSQPQPCLNRAQIQVLHRVLSGPETARGKPLYAEWPIDAGIGSSGWRLWKIGSSDGHIPALNVVLGAPALAMVFTTPPSALPANDLRANLDYALQFDFDRDAGKIYATGGEFHRSAWTDLSVRSPDLGKFRARGGRLIVYQGASDPVFSLDDTLHWYQEVERLNHGHAAGFVRVFPVPGMAHCFGGPATDEFDGLGALVTWVEKGKAPDQIPARAGRDTPWPGRTRPLCPYPQVARYVGTGSIESAKSFRCE